MSSYYVALTIEIPGRCPSFTDRFVPLFLLFQNMLCKTSFRRYCNKTGARFSQLLTDKVNKTKNKSHYNNRRILAQLCY